MRSAHHPDILINGQRKIRNGESRLPLEFSGDVVEVGGSALRCNVSTFHECTKNDLPGFRIDQFEDVASSGSFTAGVSKNLSALGNSLLIEGWIEWLCGDVRLGDGDGIGAHDKGSREC